MTEQEFVALEHRLDSIYVRRDECDEMMQELKDHQHETDVQIAVLLVKVNALVKTNWGIIAAILLYVVEEILRRLFV